MRVALLALAVVAAPLTATGAFAQRSPVVVELFTSQGCSSCPPADAFLTHLAQQRRDLLPLAYHVTYWDNIGWKDPFSLDAATARQREYARIFGDGQVYTPEMVVNGRRGFVGSRRDEGLSEISKASNARAGEIPLHLTRSGQNLVVSVGQGAEQAEVLLVGFDPEHRTTVGHGENGGRTLLESNIVRSLVSVGRWSGAPIVVRLTPPAGEQFAVLLQSDDGQILEAARLKSSSP